MSDKPEAPTGRPANEGRPRPEGHRHEGPRHEGPRRDGRPDGPRRDGPRPEGQRAEGARPEGPRRDRPPRSGRPPEAGGQPRRSEDRRGGNPQPGGESQPRREPRPQGQPRPPRPEGEKTDRGPQSQPGQPRSGGGRRNRPPRSGRPQGAPGSPGPQSGPASQNSQSTPGSPSRPDAARSEGTPSSPPGSNRSGSPSEPGERRRRRRRGRGGRGESAASQGGAADSRASQPAIQGAAPSGEARAEDSRRIAAQPAPRPVRPQDDEDDDEPKAQSAAASPDSDDDEASEVKRLRPVSQLELPPEVPVKMANLCAVRFRPAGMIHELDCGSQTYAEGELVLCESDRGQRVGRVEVPPRPRPMMGQRRRVLRKARPDEQGGFGDTQGGESDAYKFCKARLRELSLPMKLLAVELVPSQRATFYFASEDRVDFRDLVRDLSQRLRVRVEMRQVGARDGAKAIGGIGSCGRELCCSTFLPAFQPISIRMAKDQGMVLNPSKLAGQCGRLKCCLIYEHSTYKELGKTLPKVGKKVITPDGVGRVLDLDILKQRVRVYLEEGGAKSYAAAEVRPANPPQGSRETPDPGSADDLET